MSALPTGPAIFHFDVISPWSYLADVVLQREPLTVPLQRRPVLFAGLLKHFGHKGPAEIERKKVLTYELATWTAQQLDIPFVMPAVHPFNPIRYLRLLIAVGCPPRAVSGMFETIYTCGEDPASDGVWQAVLERLGLEDTPREIESPNVKTVLRNNTDLAAAQGVFGVPTITIDDRLFWGLDALPMLRAWLRGDPAFNSPAMRAARSVREGVRRE
jgi:2-hydroxychromene-2-carboxylate isomerase